MFLFHRMNMNSIKIIFLNFLMSFICELSFMDNFIFNYLKLLRKKMFLFHRMNMNSIKIILWQWQFSMDVKGQLHHE